MVALRVWPQNGQQLRAQFFAAPARRADKMARERNPVLKGLLRIRRYNQQETPYALQEVELLSWLQFGEAYSALRGWRPIPAALLSHSVLLCSGTEDNSLPTSRLRRFRSRPRQGKTTPDKHRSIRKKACPVKSFDTLAVENLIQIRGLAPILPHSGTDIKLCQRQYSTTVQLSPLAPKADDDSIIL